MRLAKQPLVSTLLVAVVIIAAILLYHWRGIQPGHAFLPVNLAQSLYPWRTLYPDTPTTNLFNADALYIHYTFLQFNVGEFQAGRLPLWDSGILSGHPAVADPLYQIFYPIWNLLALTMGNIARAYTVGIAIHVLLAAGFTYALSRTWGHRRAAAVVAAFTYALSGSMVLWMEMALNLGTMTWFPAILFAYERAVQRHSYKWTLVSALFFTLGCLAGHMQYMFTFALFWGCYALGKTFAHRADHARWSFTPLLHFGVAIGLGGLAAAPLLLPLTEFLEFTRRTTGSGLQSPLPLPQLLTLWLPNYFGSPMLGEYWGANHTEATLYGGVVAFILAVVAPFSSQRLMPRFLAGVLLLFGYVMVGGAGVALLGDLPLMHFINQTRLFVFMPLGMALFAAETLSLPKLPRLPILIVSLLVVATVATALYANVGAAHEHFDLLHSDIYRLGALVIGVAAGVYLIPLLPRGQSLLRWGMVAVVFLDLYLWGHLYNPVGRVEDILPSMPAITALERSDGYRTVAVQHDSLVVGMNLLSSFGVSEAGGYSSLVYRPILRMISKGDPENAFGLPRYSSFLMFNQPTDRLLELLQAKQVVSLYPLDGSKTPYALDPQRWQSRPLDPLILYEDSNPLPRSAVYYDSEVIADEVAAIARLHEPTFPIRERIVVPYPPTFTPQARPATPATVLLATPQRVVIEADAAQAGLLVYGEMNYPGWEVTIDGQPAPIVTANAIWRGVVIPEGQHQVEFTFRPMRLYWGMAGAGLAVILGVLLLWVTRHHKKPIAEAEKLSEKVLPMSGRCPHPEG